MPASFDQSLCNGSHTTKVNYSEIKIIATQKVTGSYYCCT
jgi:hypothetical protein